jgi:hypothetical protein
LPDMATQIDTDDLLPYRAAYLQDKVYAAQTAMSVTSKAIQIRRAMAMLVLGERVLFSCNGPLVNLENVPGYTQ